MFNLQIRLVVWVIESLKPVQICINFLVQYLIHGLQIDFRHSFSSYKIMWPTSKLSSLSFSSFASSSSDFNLFVAYVMNSVKTFFSKITFINNRSMGHISNMSNWIFPSYTNFQLSPNSAPVGYIKLYTNLNVHYTRKLAHQIDNWTSLVVPLCPRGHNVKKPESALHEDACRLIWHIVLCGSWQENF